MELPDKWQSPSDASKALQSTQGPQEENVALGTAWSLEVEAMQFAG